MLLTACLWLCQSLLWLMGLEASGSATLHVKLTNVTKNEGQVLVAVYNSQKAMRSDDPKQAVATATVKPGVDEAQFTLKPGTYAVMVMHDLNGNNKLDNNLIGIPTEPIGVSNGFKSRFRAPTFAECAFVLRPPRQQVQIELVDF